MRKSQKQLAAELAGFKITGPHEAEISVQCPKCREGAKVIRHWPTDKPADFNPPYKDAEFRCDHCGSHFWWKIPVVTQGEVQ